MRCQRELYTRASFNLSDSCISTQRYIQRVHHNDEEVKGDNNAKARPLKKTMLESNVNPPKTPFGVGRQSIVSTQNAMRVCNFRLLNKPFAARQREQVREKEEEEKHGGEIGYAMQKMPMLKMRARRSEV